MVRDYSQWLARDGVWVPRWLLILAGLCAAGWIGYRVYAPPVWMVQRLDSPDGERAARLLRTTHQRDHLMVQVKEGWLWQTYYVSDPIETDYRVDARERLHWSEQSTRLFLSVAGRPVWAYDFDARRPVPNTEWSGPGE